MRELYQLSKVLFLVENMDRAQESARECPGMAV